MHLVDPQISSARHAGLRSERTGNRIGINAWTLCFDFSSRSQSSPLNVTSLVGLNQSRRRKFIYVDIVTWVHRVIPKVIGRGATHTSRRSGYIVNRYFRHRANICAGMDEPLRRCDGKYWIRKFGWLVLRRRWTDGCVLSWHRLRCECGTEKARSGSYLVPHWVGVSSFIQCSLCRTKKKVETATTVANIHGLWRTSCVEGFCFDASDVAHRNHLSTWNPFSCDKHSFVARTLMFFFSAFTAWTINVKLRKNCSFIVALFVFDFLGWSCKVFFL